MSEELSKRKLRGIRKTLSHDYLKAKELKKKRRQERATRQKKDRHRSRKQEIEMILTDALEEDLEHGGEE